MCFVWATDTGFVQSVKAIEGPCGEKLRVHSSPIGDQQQPTIQRRVCVLSSPDWQKAGGTSKPGWSPRKVRRLSTFLGAAIVAKGSCRLTADQNA
jgi:hypothetical protein